jgi:hypothetical protein
MIFNSNCSTLTTPISSTWSTRPLLLKVNSRKWRRMAKGRCHSMDIPLEAMLDLASHSLTSFSSHHRWTERKCRCKCSAPNFRCNSHSTRCRDQMLHCSEHHSRWADKMCSSSRDRTRNLHRMHKTEEVKVWALVLSVAWMVILPDSVPTSRPLLEQEANHDLKGSRTTPMARSTMWLLKKLNRLKTLYWVCSLQAHILQQFYLIWDHRIPLYHHHF